MRFILFSLLAELTYISLMKLETVFKALQLAFIEELASIETVIKYLSFIDIIIVAGTPYRICNYRLRDPLRSL